MEKVKQVSTSQLFDKRLKDLVANIPGIVYQFQISSDGKRSLPYVSPNVFKYLGLTAEEVMQDVERWFALTHPDDLPGLEFSIVESMETMCQWQWEGRFIKNESVTYWFRGLSNPEKLDDGSILWNGVFTDITQLRKSESECGRGSVPRVDIHATSTSPPVKNQLSDNGDVADFVAPGDLKVLYVEDDQANMYLMRQIFRQTLDCDLISATTAEEGIEIARKNSLDLILMDISLPGMDGIQVLNKLKADTMTAHIPVVAVSAHAMLDQIESGKFDDFAGYLSKPFQIEDLISIIREIAA